MSCFRVIIRRATFLLFLVVICHTCFAEEMLSQKDIVELVQTSRQQYNSFEIELSEIGYKHTEGKQNTYPDQKNEIIWRNTESCSYARIEHTSFEDKDGSNNVNKEVTTKTYSITPKWSKKLQETNASNSPRGRVSRGSELEDETGLTIIDAMWGIFGQPWEKFASENAVLSKDSKSGLYTLKGQAFPDGTTITVTIDPSKNFLPIKYEFNRPNGELAIKCECSDFKKTEDGLWVPYQYIFTDEVNGYTSIHKLKNVKVNIDISKDMLDFSFPPGTIINDQIANLKYVVDGPQEDYDMLDFDTSEIKQSVESTNLDMVTINDIKTPKQAKEKELLKTHKEAQALIEKEGLTEEVNEGAKKNNMGLTFIICSSVIGVIFIILLIKCGVFVKTKQQT